MATLDEVVDHYLANFLGTIGEFQSPHYAIARDLDEVALLVGFANDFSSPKWIMSDFEDAYNEPGTFFMVRYRVDVKSYINKAEEQIRNSEDALKVEIAPLEKEKQDIKGRIKKWETTIRSRLPFAADYVQSLKAKEREIERRVREISGKYITTVYSRQRDFFRHLAARYGIESTYALQASGPDTHVKVPKLFDHRPSTPIFFTLFGNENTTDYFFDLTLRYPGNAFTVLQQLCKRTPYIVGSLGAASTGNPMHVFPDHIQRDSGLRDPRYIFFNLVKKVKLYNKPKGKRYEMDL